MKQILVVEDDQSIRISLQDLLEMEGYRVQMAANGVEALKVLESSDKPNLILLDLMMPVMDGFQFRERMNSNPDLANIPVIVMSADGNVTVKKARIGASDYLRKPIDIDVLLERIERFATSDDQSGSTN